MKKIINIFYDIRQQEWRSVLLMFALHFLLMVVLYFLKPARDSLFLVKNGPQDLPYVYILLAVVSVPATQFLSYLMRMYSVRSVLIWTLPFLGLNILIIRWFIQFNYEWIFMAFYIWVGIFSILVISLYWILANAVFKPAQSKRLFSFLTLGAILGAITGSQTSSILVSWGFLTTENLLYLCVGLLVISTVSLFFISIDSQEDENNKTVKRKKEKKASFKEIKKALKSPYQLILASVIGLTMITTTFTDFQFKTIAYDSFPVQAELTSFLGTFYAGISLASLAIQVLFSSQIIKRLGLSGAILTRPAGMMIGAILMVFEPVLASIVFLNGFDSATRYSIDKTGRELLFLPLSQNIKEQTKVFIDIFVDRFSRGLGGVVLLGFIFFLDVSVYSLTYLVIALLACWIILGVKAKKEYTEKFRKSIRNQLIETNTITLDLNEPNIYSIIQESLNSENDSQILHTLRLLEHSNNEKVVDELKILLNHSNSNIKLEALKLLQNISSVDLTEEVQHLLRDENPEVRLETIYYLCLHSEQDPSDIIKSYLSHNDDKLKSAALGCTSKYSGEISEIVDHGFFETLLKKNDRDAVVVKAQIADSLGFISEKRLAYRYLSELLNDDHPAVVRKTLGAISRQKIDRFIPLLLDKLVDYKYRSDITNTLASFGTDHLILYKNKFFDLDHKSEIQKSIPSIFSKIVNKTSVQHLLEMLTIERPDIRYHVIKALNKIKRKDLSLEIGSSTVRSIIKDEVHTYFKLFSIKELQPQYGPNQILLKALGEKIHETKERIFRLLGLLYNPDDIYGAYLALNSALPDKRSSTIEFLDNIISNEDRYYIFPLIDDIEPEAKRKLGEDRFNIPEYTYDEGLNKIINGDDIWLKACALYSVSPVCPSSLQSEVKEALSSPNHLIKETAELVNKRNSNGLSSK